jgi:hypothetical protein
MNKQIVTTQEAPTSPLYSQAGAVTKLGVDLPNVLVSIMMTAHVEG